MKRIITLIALVITVSAKSQLLTWSNSTVPFLTESYPYWQITVNANYGNQALVGYTGGVYVHMGAITTKSASASDWRYVKTVWGDTTSSTALKAPTAGTNKWAVTQVGSTLRTYFGITDTSEHILKIAILFRNGTGTIVQRNSDASDMYVPVYSTALNARIDAPLSQPTYDPLPIPLTVGIGDTLPITANASASATMTLYFNGTQIATQSAVKTIKKTATITAKGNQQIVVSATSGAVTTNDTFNFVIANANTVLPLPAGTTDGINYEPGDTSVILVLYAPHKHHVFVIGDFTNNFQELAKFQMNQTPDSSRYWYRVTGLTPGVEYGYQYVIDDSLKVADYNCEKILDPANDKYIPAATYPNLKPYPYAFTSGILSILQTAKPQYSWTTNNFVRPDKRNLVIYELLVRDFLDSVHSNWQTLQDTLTYLKTLGINAIEVMPFNEFDGNSSWGYNPSFYFAPDKAYGTELALKSFIDVCHKNGMAVIQDMVMNHSWGSNPMVQMYFNNTLGVPASNSPWFNMYPTHADNVGYQFNHQSQPTIDFTNKVIRFWLTNYKVDGFRWDLAKGFTQTQTCDGTGNNCNVAAWGNYDQSRINTWEQIYDTMQSVSPNSYCILEDFVDNSEAVVKANYGMLSWAAVYANYQAAAVGNPYSSQSWDLSATAAINQGWNNPYLVAYAESHDQERVMYLCEQNGNISGNYNVKALANGLDKIAANAAIMLMIPGPKMLYQFEELGYDTTLDRCYNGTIGTGGSCNTDPKPLLWNYTSVASRKALHDVYAKLIKFRTSPNYQSTFTTGVIANNYNLTGSVKQLKLYDPNMSVVAFGNFDVVVESNSAIGFPSNGTWYYYVGSTNNYTSITVSNYTYNFTLQPGEYYVFTSAPVNLISNVNIAGNLVTPNAKSINGATVSLNGTGSTFNGNYSYSVTSNSSNVVRATKNNDVNKTNGVTTLDIALIQSHILGKSILSSPYKIIAADVNGDNVVSAIDIVYIKRLILGLDTTFTNSKTSAKRLWTFVDSNYVFPAPTNPFPYKDSNSYAGLSASNTTQTFYGCKLGDVNWDWNPAIARTNNNNQVNAIVLSYDPITVTNGNEIRVPIKINNFKEMLGIQFTISFNADVMQWQGINNNLLNIEMGTNHANEGQITFLWVDPNNEIKTLDDGSVIMELVFTKKANCINEQLDLNSSITSVQAYDKDYQLHNVLLNASNINSVFINDNWVVSPNPAVNGVIKSQLQLKDNKTILFRLIDVNGKVVMEQKKECLRGNNYITLQENNNVPFGTYYLQALGVEGVAVKKILVK